MKILIVSNMYPTKDKPSFGIFVKNISDELVARGSEVDVCCLQPNKTKFFAYFKFILDFIFMIRGSDYDLVYTHFTSHTFFVHFLKRLSKSQLRVICHSHGSDVVTGKKSVKYKLSKYNMVNSDVLVFPSLKFKDYILDHYRIYDKKVIVYPSGGIHEQFYADIDLKDNVNKVVDYGYVGRVISKKGIFDLIASFEKLKRLQNNITLSIVGGGPDIEQLEEYVNEHNIQDVTFYGEIPQSKLPDFLHTIDCLVFPTKYKYESLGLVGLEAFASRRLLIVSDVLGPSSYANKQNSIVFAANDQLSLFNAMSKACEMKEDELSLMIKNASNTANYYASAKVNNLFYKEIEENVFYCRW